VGGGGGGGGAAGGAPAEMTKTLYAHMNKRKKLKLKKIKCELLSKANQNHEKQLIPFVFMMSFRK
jgi:hypothetical protein